MIGGHCRDHGLRIAHVFENGRPPDRPEHAFAGLVENHDRRVGRTTDGPNVNRGYRLGRRLACS